ncbi:amidohydrolase family protein [Lacibacter sp. H375]|uniref:amidohydrolase family protein n=1 Tax=Lacibacter sp. H375 TaxID=3133424 RepID=UPI0030BDED4A
MHKLFCYIPILLSVFSCKQSVTGDILIENVNVIDMEAGKIIPSQDVVITANKITNIVYHGDIDIHSNTVINGSNQYLIPGFWDMHEHMMRYQWYKSQMPLLRANGITGFREMWGDLTIATYVQSQIQNDSLPYFRFVASGHILDGKKAFWEGSIPVATKVAAIKIVDSLRNAKVDFIKTYSFLSPDVFYTIAERCKENKFPFAGHVPHTVWLTEASDAGMASMEHLYGFLTEACSNSDSAMALMKRSVAAFESGNKEERAKISLLFHSLVLNNFSEEKLITIAKRLRKNNTYIVPTLVTLRGQYFTNDTSFTNDPRLKYMSKETLEYWKEQTRNDLEKNTDIQWQNMRKRWQIEKQIMRILISEKVPIMAGTDADNPYAFPGFSLHDEMALYVECGMTPLEALRSAITVPVKFLKMSDSLGTIKKDKLADLVLLEANPLDDIKNTTKINTVIANGRLYDKKYINSILKK